MAKRVLIRKAVDYIATLPAGLKITMNDVVAHACPEEAANSTLDYSLLDEIIDAAEEKGIELDYSAHDDMGREPFAVDFVVRKRDRNGR